jgi:Na+/H+ antiporter NhaC
MGKSKSQSPESPDAISFDHIKSRGYWAFSAAHVLMVFMAAVCRKLPIES